MNIIEKLEALVKEYEDGFDAGSLQLHCVADLRAIIDEFKSTQEPFGYVSDSTYSVTDNGTVRKTANDVFKTPLFTQPQLSDETMKVTEGYALVPIEPTEDMEFYGNQKADTIGIHINFGEYNHDLSMAREVYKAMIDEAMKASNVPE